MDKVRPPSLADGGKHRLGIDAARLVRNQDIFILIYDGKRGLLLLSGRHVIAHDVPLSERDVASDANAVDADIALFQQTAQAKRSLRTGVIGERGERCVFGDDVFLHDVF